MTRFFIFVLLLISLPSVAWCDRGGFYLGAQLGANLLDTVAATGEDGSFDLNLTGGGMGSVLVGYDYADSQPKLAQGRVELELSWRQNPLDTVGFSNGEFPATGDLTAQSALLNFFYEYHGLKPLLAYYGVGGGVARISLDNAAVSGASIADDTDDVLAYQVGAGLGYQVNPDLTLDLGYRFFATQDPEFEDSRGSKFTTEYQSHTLLLGVRYTF